MAEKLEALLALPGGKRLPCQDVFRGIAKEYPELVPRLEKIVKQFVEELNKPHKPAKEAGIKIDVGSGWALVAQQSFTTPRGRFDVEFGSNKSLLLHGKSVTHSVTVSGAIILPSILQADKDRVLLILQKPLAIGKQSVACMLLTPTPTAPKSDLISATVSRDAGSLTEGTKVDNYAMDAWKYLLDQGLGIPAKELTTDVFRSSAGLAGVKCYHNVNDGFLYPTELGLVFIQKPLLFLAKEEIKGVDVRGTFSGATRNFDAIIHMKDDTLHEIRMIQVAEHDNLRAYLAKMQFDAAQDSGEDTGEENGNGGSVGESEGEELGKSSGEESEDSNFGESSDSSSSESDCDRESDIDSSDIDINQDVPEEDESSIVKLVKTQRRQATISLSSSPLSSSSSSKPPDVSAPVAAGEVVPGPGHAQEGPLLGDIEEGSTASESEGERDSKRPRTDHET